MECWKSCIWSERANTTTSAISTRAGSSIWSRASRRRSSILASAATAFCTSATSSRSIFARADTIRASRSCRTAARRRDRDFERRERRRRRIARRPSRRRTTAAETAAAPQTARYRTGVRPRFKPPIQEIFQRGDEVLVQVIKEGIGTKGPTLSTYISIPGRYLVLMPALGRIGVSRKIESDEDRRRLRDILRELNPPKGVGFIVRTAGTDRTKKELSRDLAYLLRLWKVIVRRIKKTTGPVDIYEESDMIIRTIRDIFTGDVDTIYIDEPKAFERAKEFLQIVMPRYVNRLQALRGPRAAVPQVQPRRGDRPDQPAAACRSRAAARS